MSDTWRTMLTGVDENVQLRIVTPAGDALCASLIWLAINARLRDGELIKFLYRDPVDPENPEVPRPMRQATLRITEDKVFDHMTDSGLIPPG